MWCQKVPWRQNVRQDVNKCNIRHDVKKFVISKNCHNAINTSWCQSVCYDIKRFIITSKSLSLLQNVRHNIKKHHNIKKCMTQSSSWRHQVCHDIKNRPWLQRVCHNAKRLSWSQNTSWRQTFCHEVKTYHNITKCVIISKSHLHYILFPKYWQKYVITTKVRHNVVRQDVKSVSCRQKIPWHQNVCHDVNKCNIIQKVSHDVKNTSMTSKTRHDIKRFVIIYDNVNDIKHTFS